MSYAPPNIDPANLDTLTGAFEEIFKNLVHNTDGMLPAKVLSYSSGPPARAQVQPLISVVDTKGNYTIRANIASIPVLQLGGGGFFMNFPLKAGDLGWIFASDRDISLFLQYYNETIPNTARVKDFSSALFIPHLMTNYSIASEDANNLVIQSADGSVKVSLGTNLATVQAPTVNINGTGRVNLGGTSGGTGVARIGDAVSGGVITGGSTKVFSN